MQHTYLIELSKEPLFKEPLKVMTVVHEFRRGRDILERNGEEVCAHPQDFRCGIIRT